MKKKFKCTGCGNDRPCYLETNQDSVLGVPELESYELKCVFDETNKTSYNWKEVSL